MYQEKEITEKVHNNIMNSIKLENRMDAIFSNSKKSVTSDPHRLLHNPADEVHLRTSDKYVALSNLRIHSTCKDIKSAYKNNKFNISAPT